MRISWTTYTMRVFGTALKAVRCQHCRQDYYYEMLRVSTSSATAVDWGIMGHDEAGAAFQSNRVARGGLAEMLARETDPVSCPKCNRLQPDAPPALQSGKIPVPGMPPALVWSPEFDANGQPTGGQFVTGRVQKIEAENGAVIVQLPRIELPDACCLCGRTATQPFKLPGQGSKRVLELSVRTCKPCAAALRWKGYKVMAVGWLIGLMLSAVLFVLIGRKFDLTLKLITTTITTVAIGLFLSFNLPYFFLLPYHDRVIDPKRAIVRLRFRSPVYLAMVADAATRSANSGKVFAESAEAEMASNLGEITE